MVLVFGIAELQFVSELALNSWAAAFLAVPADRFSNCIDEPAHNLEPYTALGNSHNSEGLD